MSTPIQNSNETVQNRIIIPSLNKAINQHKQDGENKEKKKKFDEEKRSGKIRFQKKVGLGFLDKY